METPTPSAPLTVVVVEDNPTDVSIMQWVLQAQDFAYDLHVIDNGDHVLQVVDHLIQQEPWRLPIMMLLDLALPQRDGKDILRSLKAIHHGADIRVVIVTGSADPRDRAETLALGANGYFVKPSQRMPFMQLGALIKDVAFGHAARGSSAPGAEPSRSPRGQRVLVVDDDADMASFSQHVLTRVGYEVVVLTRSPEALATFQAAPQRFAALITDYHMPGLSGIALAAACRQVRGDLPIILCTGESPSVYAAQAAAQGIDAMLPKPFRPSELTGTLQHVLASHATSGMP